jgi:hypothetical protein
MLLINTKERAEIVSPNKIIAVEKIAEFCYSMVFKFEFHPKWEFKFMDDKNSIVVLKEAS